MTQHQTSATESSTKAPAPNNQKKYWVEIQLIDDSGNAVANMPYRAENQATRTKHAETYSGNSDASGIIRIENLLPLDLTLFIEAQPLTDEMEKRPLGVEMMGAYQRKMTPFTAKNGQIYYHTVIGSLCDKAPDIPDWKEEALPEFHFPDKKFCGLQIYSMHFNSQVKVEICPFRAWNLLLHHTKDYSIVNAMNLGLMANFSYESGDTIRAFFNKQCQNLSQVPPLVCRPVAIDVPFRDRYIDPVFLDTTEGESAEGGTQLFYVRNTKQLLIGWRGTEPTKLADIVADGTFRPIPCPEILPGGRGHKGFLDAFWLVKNKFAKDFTTITQLSADAELFICGHSLGGALTLIHASTLRDYDPVIYTYGMPRIFSASSVEVLSNITHYRHVNDTDSVTSVPPAAEVDNSMYDTAGPYGIIFGVASSVGEITAQSLGAKFGDPYMHHGNIAVFFKAEQSLLRPSAYASVVSGVLGVNLYAISEMMTKRTKFYLVPSLNESMFCKATDHQHNYFKCLDQKSVDRYFPKNNNPALDSVSNPANHSMQNKYVPFLNNQLIELVNPDLTMERKEMRQAFSEQVDKAEKKATSSQDEITRNRIFLALQEMLPVTLDISESDIAWGNALLRFKETAKEEHENIN